MSKKLTQEFIALKAKSDRLQSITKLNLWGSDIDDVSIFKKMPMLEVVSLSVNKIRTLKDFSDMENLRELYLRNNLISDIREVKYLSTCPNLKILSLNENPIANMKGYRDTILRILPNLQKLDEAIVTEAEKEAAFNNFMNEDDENEEEYQKEEYTPSQKQKYNIEEETEYKSYNKRSSNKKGNRDFDINNDDYNQEYDDEYEKKYSQYKKSNQRRVSNEREDYDEYNQRRPQQQQPVYRKKRTEQYEQHDEYIEQRKPRSNYRESNVLSSVLLLIKELNENELDKVRDEIERKLNC